MSDHPSALTAAGRKLGARGWEIRPLPYTHPDVLQLVEEVQQEYTRRYGGRDESPAEPGMFDPPLGAFFVGYLDDRPVAMGGWRMRTDLSALGRSRPAEVRRMYVGPSVRRTGLGSQVLMHLEATARSAGADLMVLETGLPQPEAIALYTAAGYQQIEKFGYYQWSPRSRCFGKAL